MERFITPCGAGLEAGGWELWKWSRNHWQISNFLSQSPSRVQAPVEIPPSHSSRFDNAETSDKNIGRNSIPRVGSWNTPTFDEPLHSLRIEDTVETSDFFDRNIGRSRTNVMWDRTESWRIGGEYIRAQSQDDHMHSLSSSWSQFWRDWSSNYSRIEYNAEISNK